ncbi:MAG: hydroxymethylbilane synthase [Bacteroidota bacterium]
MPAERIVIGTRGSELALWQSRFIQSSLNELFPSCTVELTVIKTLGDKILDSPLSKIGDKGLFTKEIEKALLDGTIDLAVHSLKDIPTLIPRGLTLGAITKREDVRDVFIAHPAKPHRTLAEVPRGGAIATGSLRRKCQLLHLRPDLHIVDLRGNLNTRMKKLEESSWDGMVLAYAGLKRLGWEKRMTEVLSCDTLLPAVGQGALGIETRQGDQRVRKMVQKLHHLPTAQSVTGERSLLRHLEGGCQVPIGTFGRIEKGRFRLEALVGSLDGTRIVRGHIVGDPDRSESLGVELAKQLLESGAREILEAIRLTGTTIPRAEV